MSTIWEKPEFINFRQDSDNSFARNKLSKFIVNKCIKTEIKKWYGNINITSRLALYTHSKLTKSLKADDFFRWIEGECQKHHLVMRKKKEGMIGKLLEELKILTQTTLSPRQCYLRLVNLSST